MKNNKKLLSKLLTIILSTMMVFSSVLVVNTNVVLAETSDEQTNEVAPETEEKIEPSEEEKTVIEEKVDNGSDNTIINEGSDDTTSGDELKEEPVVVNEVIEEEVKEDIEETNNKSNISLKSTAPMKAGALGINLGFKIYSAVFYTIDSNGRKTKYYTQSKLGKSDVIKKPADPAPVHEGETFAGWYERLYVLGQLVAEREWNFATPDHVIDSCIFTELLDIPTTFTIELYPKFISEANSNYETYFDFKVKHKNSYGIDINNNGTIDLNNADEVAAFDEFKVNNTTGDFLKVGEDGYLYSYYSYYKTEDGWKIVDFFKEIKHINDPYYFVKDYQYVLSSDQVEIKTGLTETEKNNLLEEFADEDNTGYICQKYDTDSDGDIDHLDVDYTGSKYTVTKEGDDNYTVQIGEYYVGTAFDLAIQEANEDDTIVLLPHNFDNGQLYNNDFYIVKPIEIWGDVNLDLNGCTVTFNENSISLDILHFFDRARRNRELIFPKEICAAIYVSNAKTTISNGTINNLHASGKGILVTSDQPSWVTTIEDIEIHVKEGNNAIESGCYSFDDNGNVDGINRGYVNVKSGLIDGYILNNDRGDLKINGETTYKVVNNEITDQYVYTGVKFTKDPTVKANGVDSTNVLLGSGYQIWEDGVGKYKYYVDATAEAELLVNDTTTQYKHLETAIYEFKNGSNASGTITLLKDREQNGKILPIDVGNKSLTLNFDSNRINDGDLEIRSGNVTLTGNGYVNNVRYAGGNLYILDGHYDDLAYTTTNVQNIYVSGGFYKKKLSASILKDTNPNDQFKCVSSDMPGYQYQVLPVGEIQQVKLYLNNSLVDNTKYPGLISAINAINEGIIEADTIELLRSITVNDVITINKPITLDLGTFTINSNVVLGGEEEFPEVPLFEDEEEEDPEIILDINTPYEPLGDIYSVYIDINDSNKNVVIKNGAIVNKSEIEDGNSSTAYGIYNVNGNVTTNGFNLVIDAKNFDRMTAIYNGTSGSIELENYSRIRSLQNAKSGWEATTAENVDFVINDGTLNICDKSQIYIACGDKTQSLTGIINNGILTVDNPNHVDNNITVNSRSSVLCDTYGIKNTGIIYMYGCQMSISNEQGNCYGLFATNNSTNEAKNMFLDKDTYLSISKNDTSNRNTYGVYVTAPRVINSEKTEPMNIMLGKCKVIIGSRDKAYGICSYGGRIVSATINGDVAPANTVLNSNTQTKPDQASEDNAAEIIINAGSGSVGIDNEYIGEAGTASSQLANTYISMEKSMSYVYGDDIYCVKSGTSSNGIYIYDGYYSNVGNNGLLSTNVNACGGYYSKRVTPAKNYICVELEEKKNHTNPLHSINNDYFYTILSDGSSMSATVPDSKGSFEVIIKVKYDTYMLDNPDKYGVIIQSEAFGNDYIRLSIAQSIKQISEDIDITSDYPFEYKFSMPAKNVSEKFSISIVDFMQQEPHVYRSVSNYSIEKYCYTVLKTKNTKGKYAYTSLQRSLCASMLNYGTYAQLYFNPSIAESNLANRELGIYPIDNGSTTMFSKLVSYNEDLSERDNPTDYSTIFKTLAHSISLNTNSYGLQFAFELADALKNTEIKFYCDGKEIKPINDGNLWYIDVDNIATRELDRDYGIQIVAGGNTYNMAYALVDYIYDANNKGIAGESPLKNLLNSLYEYYIVVQNFVR